MEPYFNSEEHLWFLDVVEESRREGEIKVRESEGERENKEDMKNALQCFSGVVYKMR